MKTKLIRILTATSLLSTAWLVSGESTQLPVSPEPQVQKIAEVASMYKGVVKLHVELGQKVKKGDLLFELNNEILQSQLKGASKNLKITKDIQEAGAKLAKSQAISIQDYQWVYHDFIYEKEEQQIILDTMNNSKYYSPFDGTVSVIYRYDGSGLGDNDTEIIVTEGDIKVDTSNQIAMVCNRWAGIIDLKVNLGQEVKKGNILFKTSTNVLENQLKADQDRWSRTKEIYERQCKLRESNVSSVLEKLKSEYDYNKATTDLEVDKLMLQQSTGYAPFDGKITKIYRYSGSGNGDCKPVVEITKNN